MAAKKRTVNNLSSLLDVLQSKVDDGAGDDQPNVKLREVLQVVGRRAYGPLLLIIGLISISPLTMIPGSTWAFALLTLLIAIQLLFHKNTPWLPRGALDLELSETALGRFISASRPTARFIDGIIRPRLEFMAQPPFVFLIALMCVLAALVTFPLGLIPFAPALPGFAIVLFGLGLTARDGLLLTLGTAVIGCACWLLFTRIF